MPTFGNTSNLGSGFYSNGKIAGSLFTLTENAVPYTIYAKVYTFGQVVRYKCAIYDSAGNYVCSTEEKTITGTPADYTPFAIQGTLPSMPAGNYYLMIWTENIWGGCCAAGWVGSAGIKTVVEAVSPPAYGGAFPATIAISPTLVVDSTWTAIYCEYALNAALSVTVVPSEATVQTNMTQVFTATPIGGTPPYASYEWHDETGIIGNSQQLVYGKPVAGLYHIYVVVTDSAGTAVPSPVVNVTVTSDVVGEMFDSCDSLTPANGAWVATQDTGFALNTINTVNGRLEMTFAATPQTYPFNYGAVFYKRPPTGQVWNFAGKELVRLRISKSSALAAADISRLELGITGSPWVGAEYAIGSKITEFDNEMVIDVDLRNPDSGDPAVNLANIVQFHFAIVDGNTVTGPTGIAVNSIELLPPPYYPLEARITPTTGSEIYVGDATTFTAIGVYGTSPYTYKWFVNGVQEATTSSTFSFSRTTSGSYTIYCEVSDATAMVPTPTITMTVLTDPTPIPPTLPNWILINDQPWVYQKKFVLNPEYRHALLRDLSIANIKNVIIFCGYWDATNPQAPTVWHFDSAYNMIPGFARTNAEYQQLISELHALGMDVYCWIEDHSSTGSMDISVANVPNVMVPILECLNIGFDGYCDDTEKFIGWVDTGNDAADQVANFALQVPFWGALTDAIHAVGKKHAPFVGIDWVQSVNHKLTNVDFINSMFYSDVSALSDTAQSHLYWQEEFGELNKVPPTPPASPLIIGLLIGNSNPAPWGELATQLARLDELIPAYQHPNLYGFFIWLYEYMTPADWQAWYGWVNKLPLYGIPPTTGTTYTLTVLTPTGGMVSPTSGTYAEGTYVPCTATASTGYQFSHWKLDSIDVGSQITYNVLMTSNHTIEAIFTTLQQNITLNVVAGTGGSVNAGSPITVTVGQSYEFMATPSTGYLFDHWDLSGDNKGSTAILFLNITADMNGKTLTALFMVEPPPQVTVMLEVAGNGTIDIGTGPQVFHVGDVVRITAIAPTGATFQGWKLDGANYSTTNPLDLTVTLELNGSTLTADFTAPIPIIQAGVGLLGLGLVYFLARGKKKRKGVKW